MYNATFRERPLRTNAPTQPTKGVKMDNKRISEIVDEEMIKQDANRYRDMRKNITIPKRIVDEIDKFAHTNWANWQFYFYSDEMSEELVDWLDNGDSEFTNSKIAMVYLNPLTRDLVEVVKDE
ncbi:hypothetical protein LW81_078 [Lactococcus phage LW81]|uniref:Uncharacterized protein n=1 Tax=Lactococcus phage LW81 TaxID=1965482 RepID=A0A1W6JN63_9CAUD|nr:hypothetical protein H1Z34_gp078 [Lactococcus phage LW81]ARM67648.1 hypothetical protein LW81_078 [Lactococcus phage LW81]